LSLLTLNAAKKEKRRFQNESQRQHGATVWLDIARHPSQPVV